MEKPLFAQGGNVVYAVVTAHVLLNDIQYNMWEHNRSLDEARATRLADMQQRLAAEGGNPGPLFLPTPITFCMCGEMRYLMDGQHRIRALRILAGRGFDLSSIDVLICQIRCETAAAMEIAFVRINSGTPVPSEYYDNKVRRLLGVFSELFMQTFGAAVSTASRPPRPFVLLEAVRTEMSAHIPLRDAILDDRVQPEDLMRLIVSENELEKMTEGKGVKGITPAMVARARKCNFFLGLRPGWATAIAARAAHPEVLEVSEDDADRMDGLQ